MSFTIKFEDVFAAYNDAKRHKANSKAHKEFTKGLSKNLYQLYKDLVSGNYRIGKSICFVVSHPSPREVLAASFRDRIVHHLIMRQLMPIFERIFIRNNFSCMKGRGTYDGVVKLREAMARHPNGYVYKFDLKNFFMSINKNILLEKLKKLINEEFNEDDNTREMLLFLVELIVMHHPEEKGNYVKHGNLKLWKKIPKEKSLFFVNKNKGLPIGNLTSQLFASLYLNEFDNMMYEFFGEDYGRYVDDFFIVTDNKNLMKYVLLIIEEKLKSLELTLHPNKRYCQPISHGCKFLGSVTKRGRLYTGNGTLSNFYNSLNKINKKLNENSIEDIKEVRNTVNSYLGFTRHYNEFSNRKKFLNLLCEKWLVFFEVDKNYDKIQLREEYKPINLIQ